MDPAGFRGDEGPGGIVSRILQVALGLFVTTLELPTLEPHEGGAADMLASHQINCQIESAMFSFTYWTIGSADLQICLLDQSMRQFNCTGILESQVQPGKVALKIPPIDHPFHIAIIPDAHPGILVVDDIKYDADFCQLPQDRGFISSPSPPLFPTSSSPHDMLPGMPFESIGHATTQMSTTTTPPPTTTTTSDDLITTPEEEYSEEHEEDRQVARTRPTTTGTTEETTTPGVEPDPPFDLFIHGNKTQPLFDRRRGKIIEDTQDLLCDFGFNFPLLLGSRSRSMGDHREGLEENADGRSELPAYPAALVIQGTAMFASDPLRCQTGPGKLMFRYWANKKVTLQVCALGYNLDSNKIQCAEQHTSEENVEITLAVFDLIHEIHEPFTLNIVPMWERATRNGFLVLDEIAYMGECNTTLLENSGETESTRWPKRKGNELKPKQVKPLIPTVAPEVRPVTSTRPFVLTTPSRPEGTKRAGKGNAQEITSPPSTTPEETTVETTEEETTPSTTTELSTTTRQTVATVTFYPGMVVQRTTLKNSFTIPYTTTPRFVTTTTEAVLDYCKLLNCDFNVPWTLRNKGYGFPLSRHTDLRPTPTNGQFVSTILGPGDFAILESPRFNLTQGINVLLFQYYRPSHSSTIRLCLGTRYTKPLRTISSFIQCPPIPAFYLVAHNLDRSTEKAAIAIDNIRVAICDPRTFDAVVEPPADQPSD
ncbi:MAM domain-containing protein [Aphelenchoides fujianensis]|nr:MAM domain-containing protein [Aphelenchoides fujianensis]